MPERRRVLIVGAGAAGTAAAWSLGRYPDRFDVEVWEKESKAGGVATTEDILGGQRINDGVQGGSFTYRNTLALLSLFGFDVKATAMTIAFGKGDRMWSNIEHTEFAKRMEPEIRRFGGVLRTISRLEPIFAFIPIAKVLKVWRFSDDFTYGMVFPLTALFFGTGNQTPNVASAIVARVFLDSKLRLFDYDAKWLLSQTPQMFAFPPLGDIYDAVAKRTKCVRWKFDQPASSVRRLGKAEQESMASRGELTGNVCARDPYGCAHYFDEVIFACDAETISRKLLTDPTIAERHILSSVEYFTDITITHVDEDYMNAEYEMASAATRDASVDAGDTKTKTTTKRSQANSQPTTSSDKMYFIRVDPVDKSQIEMSFDLTNYQPQLRIAGAGSIYQSIFLDVHNSARWTIEKIRSDKILLRKWWRQFGHTWKHYLKVVPWVRFLQNPARHTYYAGSWTLVNTHEIAIISGLAAAHRLGADYPFEHDQLAKDQFEQYLFMIHGVRHTGFRSDSSVPDRRRGVITVLHGILFSILTVLTTINRYLIG